MNIEAPITEIPNPLTIDLDMADATGMVRLFRQADEQLFAGWGVHPSMLDDEMVAKCAALAVRTAEVLAAGSKGQVLLSGAGTSGRFAQLLSRQFNRMLANAHKPASFKPLVAGGALALVKAQEGAEDDASVAKADLSNVLADDATEVIYFGITCGLSAPYIAGQLDSLAGRKGATSVLLGFSPAEASRDVPIEGWDKTFAEVLAARTGQPDFVLLNPVYGPEAVMGSTRMKGGSATKILLETIFYVAFELAGLIIPESGSQQPLSTSDPASIQRRVRELLRRYREAMHATYDNLPCMAELTRLAGATLRSGGKVSYLGRDTAGILGLIDASECPPTFGATFEDIRGYLRDGWQELLDDDRDLSDSGPEFQISMENFDKKKLPGLAKGDLVLGVAIGEVGPVTRRLLESAAKTKATVGLVFVTAVPPKKGDIPPELGDIHPVIIPSLGFTPGFLNLAEFALKLVLNSISTGAHIAIGKVYENRMIDLRISNNKLYYRSLRIIDMLAHCGEDTARSALHRAVFRKDALSPDEASAPPSTIIKAATDVQRVVPTALLLAMGDMTVEQARELLAEDPVPRRVIQRQLDKRASD